MNTTALSRRKEEYEMDLWVVKYASRRSRTGALSGDSSVRRARMRGQRGLSDQGVEPCRIKGARIDLFVIYWVHAPAARVLT